MEYQQIIKLIQEIDSIETDEYGRTKKTRIEKEIFAEEKSVGQKEFYQADARGFKAEKVFEIADYLDYENENVLEHNGVEYTIYRTFRKGMGLELFVSGLVNHGSA